MAGYSLLYSLLAPLAGTPGRGDRHGRASGRSRWSPTGSRRRPRRGARDVAVPGGVLSNLLVGRMPFALGIALAVGAGRACSARAPRGCRWQARGRAPSRASSCASVGGAVRRARSGRGRPGRPRAAVVLGAPAPDRGLTMAALFPEGGTGNCSVATAFWPMLLVCLAALVLVDPRAASRVGGGAQCRDPRAVRDPERARAERAAPQSPGRRGAARPRRAPARPAPRS